MAGDRGQAQEPPRQRRPGDPAAAAAQARPKARTEPSPRRRPATVVEELDVATLLGDAAPAAAPAPPTRRPAPAAAPAARRPAAPRLDVPTRRERQAAQRLQARKVGRLVRRVEPWSVLKFSLVYLLALDLALLLAGAALWRLGAGAGWIEDLERFVGELFQLDAFRFDGRQIFSVAALVGFLFVLCGALAATGLAALFNLISDLTGGIRLSVVEEETARPAPRR